MMLVRGLSAREIYFYRLHEYDDLLFMMRFLRAGDRLIDVGGNAGIYSLLAASTCDAEVEAFEPVPAIANMFERNIRENGFDLRVRLHRKAVGAQVGHIHLSANDGPTTHQVSAGEQDSIHVELCRLDDAVLDDGRATLLKIDVEGLEMDVLEGAKKWLASPSLSVILLETSGHGLRYGYDDDELHRLLLRSEFTPVRYHADDNEIERLPVPRTGGNTLYVRSLEDCAERCSASIH
jgi:FkbM family methyltransferase